MRIRAGLERFAKMGRGDLKKLKGIHGGQTCIDFA